MKLPLSEFRFNVPRAAAEASSTTTSPGEDGNSRSMPHSAVRQALSSRFRPRQGEESAAPPAKRRAGLGNGAELSQLEALPSEVVHKIAELLPAQDAASMSATSRTMHAASKTRLDSLSALNLAQGFLAVRSHEAFMESLSLLQASGISRDHHEKPLVSLGAIINGLPEAERPEAIEEFVKSVDAFIGFMDKPGGKLADGDSLLMVLRRAAQLGPQGLADRERAVIKTHGEAEIRAGKNAQDVAKRLGVNPRELERMSASPGEGTKPAGPAYCAAARGRLDFDRILQRYGIADPDIIASLERLHGSSRDAIRPQETREQVMRRLGPGVAIAHFGRGSGI